MGSPRSCGEYINVYRESYIFLFTIDQNTTVTFVEKIARSFLHAVDEIASFSFQFSFNVKSLLGGFAFVLSYGLLVLYKTFDEKSTPK